MFTGIVEELGRVRSIVPNEGGARFVFEAEVVLDDIELGASIAVNGCCLTVATKDGETFTADVMKETLDKTSLGALSAYADILIEMSGYRRLRSPDRRRHLRAYSRQDEFAADRMAAVPRESSGPLGTSKSRISKASMRILRVAISTVSPARASS